ncbi:MAG: hypothetical protein ABIG63_08695 [Chloroflexota bacterium]
MKRLMALVLMVGGFLVVLTGAVCYGEDKPPIFTVETSGGDVQGSFRIIESCEEFRAALELALKYLDSDDWTLIVSGGVRDNDQMQRQLGSDIERIRAVLRQW